MDGSKAAARGASFGLSLLVALGWYATVIAAVVVGQSGIPAAPDRDCSAMFSCLAPQDGIVLILIVAAPVLAVLALCTVVVAALLTRVSRSPILVGTLSTVGGIAVVAVVGTVWQGVR
ncbi:hypothetical protein [Asanoa sp. NPDC050611]|uniref:hypothetical protein n=1 Tax=Asanoa sp. NPDC050611 TaxID=3157098 RepID=UPI0033E1D609